MDRTALFLLGFAITLALTAATEISVIHLGSEVEHTTAALFAMSLAAFPAYAVASRIRSERILLSLWIVSGIAVMGLPQVASAASWISARGIDPVRGDWRGSLAFAFIALCALGPFATLLLIGLFARLEQLARSSEPATTDLGPALAMLGASAALAISPYAITVGLGAAGCVKLAGTLLMVAAALRFAAGGPEQLRESTAAEYFESNVLFCAAFVALGMAAGRASALLDIRAEGTEDAAYLGPLAVAVVGALTLAIAAPFVEPNRLSGHFACALPRFVLGAAMGRILPRPDQSTLVTLSATCALAAALAILGIWSATRRGIAQTRIPGVLAISALVLGFAVARDRIGCESDGAVYSTVTSQIDGRVRPFLEGAPLFPLDVDDGGVVRAVAIVLAHAAPPERCAVLGSGGAAFAEALARGTTAQVTFVTPLRHEADAILATAPSFSVVNAPERLWLERVESAFDVVVLAPPCRTPRRIARRSTAEFGALALTRVRSGGVLVQTFHLGSNDAVDLFQKLLPTAGFSDYRLFLDHPGSPAPFFLRIVGKDTPQPFLEHARSRLDDLVLRLPELERFDFDLRTMLQCFAFDRSILDLWYRESWVNTDDRCRLSRTLTPVHALEPDLRARIRSGIEQRRISLASRLRETAEISPMFVELDDVIHHDHEAVRELSNFAIERAKRGDISLALDWLPGAAELDRLLFALSSSPTLSLLLRPIDRARRVSIDRGATKFTFSILERMLYANPNHFGWRMDLADVAERLGRISVARQNYRSILAEQESHASANLRMAYVLAGMGRNSRSEALVRLDRAIDLDAAQLAEMDVRRARFVRAVLRGDMPTARAIDAEIPESERVGPLLRVLRTRLIE